MKTLLVCLLALLACDLAAGQSEQTPIQLGSVAFSGSIRERYEAWDWFEPARDKISTAISGTLMRFSFSQKKLKLTTGTSNCGAGAAGATE